MTMRRWHLSGSERIEAEYRKLDNRWMHIHYRIMIVALLLAAAAEMGMYLILRQIGPSFGGARDYWIRFVAVPIAGNLLIVAVAEFFMRTSKLLLISKIWATSLLCSIMVLWIYAIHMFYAAMSLIFVVPALLTMAYGSKRLTTTIGGLCFAEKIIADLWLNGWSGRPSPLEDDSVLIDFIMSIILLSFFFLLAWFISGIESDKNRAGITLERESHLYKMQSITDPLTQLGNRLAFEEILQQLARDNILCRCHAAMPDMDNFKRLNDTCGHASGDECLRTFGRTLRSITTRDVEGFRLGGDEFCMLFLDKDSEQVEAICRALQYAFHAASTGTEYSIVHVSIGIAQALPDDSATAMLGRADSALYQAKHHQKGSIRFYRPEAKNADTA